MSDETTVVLADDHEPTRLGVRMALEPHGFRIVAEVGTAWDAVAAAVEHRPDVCLLDVNMPGNGIAAAEEIGVALPDTKIVMLTVSDSDDDMFAALRAGADGYLLKSMATDRLAHAVRGLVNGEAALTRELTARLIKVFRSGGRARRLLLSDRRVELTAREFEVLERLRLGEPTGRIASQLGISDVTVRRHISAILQKLGVPDRQSALELLDREDQRRRERDSETYAQSG